ncbi:MAG: Oleate hydratase (EC [uncultured Paraburkholderia sp.]|nr:MAG: Oleate hydratase (EC [uncultured Paraburkholderia sp.]
MGRRRLTCINGVAVAAPRAPLIQRNERPGRAGMVYTFTAITRGDHQMNHDEYAGTRPLTAAARNEAIESGHFYLVGGGIASLAAAAFLIRDADVPGCRITILEALGKAGGSLDGAGTPQDGYVVRGGRMLESKYLCTYDLFDSIPTLDGRSSVTKEIFDWNETIRTSSKSRLVRDGKREDAPAYGLGEAHLLTLGRLSLEPEALLGDSRISDHFEADFFETNFWIMWCTTFAFQPWHSAAEFRRYLLRFAHMTPGFNQLHGIMRTVYNQYDSMVRPLRKWLDEHGVVFLNNTRVVDLRYDESGELNRVAAILCEHDRRRDEIALGPHDKVMITLGSMTAGSSLGATDRAAVFNRDDSSGAWALWKTIAAGRGEFCHPSVFADHVDESRWLSFTATLHDPTLFRLIRDLTGNVPGEGGLITFAQSNWLASIVLPHQPHFIGQPKDVQVFWGYGLFIDRPGNFVAKPMVGMHGPRDHDRAARPFAYRGAGRAYSRRRHLQWCTARLRRCRAADGTEDTTTAAPRSAVQSAATRKPFGETPWSPTQASLNARPARSRRVARVACAPARTSARAHRARPDYRRRRRRPERHRHLFAGRRAIRA